MLLQEIIHHSLYYFRHANNSHTSFNLMIHDTKEVDDKKKFVCVCVCVCVCMCVCLCECVCGEGDGGEKYRISRGRSIRILSK